MSQEIVGVIPHPAEQKRPEGNFKATKYAEIVEMQNKVKEVDVVLKVHHFSSFYEYGGGKWFWNGCHWDTLDFESFLDFHNLLRQHHYFLVRTNEHESFACIYKIDDLELLEIMQELFNQMNERAQPKLLC